MHELFSSIYFVKYPMLRSRKDSRLALFVTKLHMWRIVLTHITAYITFKLITTAMFNIDIKLILNQSSLPILLALQNRWRWPILWPFFLFEYLFAFYNFMCIEYFGALLCNRKTWSKFPIEIDVVIFMYCAPCFFLLLFLHYLSTKLSSFIQLHLHSASIRMEYVKLLPMHAMLWQYFKWTNYYPNPENIRSEVNLMNMHIYSCEL